MNTDDLGRPVDSDLEYVIGPDGSLSFPDTPPARVLADAIPGAYTIVVDRNGDGLFHAAFDVVDPDGFVVSGAKPIPTVSEWGLIVLALLLLAGAKIYFGRCRPAAG